MLQLQFNADIHSSCMQVIPDVKLMLFFIESHKGPPVEDLVYPYYRAFMSINCFNIDNSCCHGLC